MRTNTAKQQLQSGQPSIGSWLSLGSVLASRFLAKAGFDWLTVDVEHSSVSMETAGLMFGAIADAGCIPLARVPSNRHDHIKRMLDCGAMGVVVPMVMNREEAEAAVAACRYPPRGNRSVGGSAHALNFDATPEEYFAKADDEILIVLQCEHHEAAARADEIFSVPGIDAIFVGPFDLAASMRKADGTPPSAAERAEMHGRILASCRKHGVPAGIHCGSAEEAQQHIQDGWQFLAITSELKMMTDGAEAVLNRFNKLKTRGARY